MSSTAPASATLLDVDEALFTRRLLLQDDVVGHEPEELTQLLPEQSPLATAVTIKPEPGVCVKTRLSGGSNAKVFLNICTCQVIPAPEDLTDQELIEILESDEPSSFRIPMSIGAPHEEEDKSGKSCTAYDVVINPAFLDKTKNNPLFHNFFVVATMEALEGKYDLQLDKNMWTMLKNKLYLGTMPQQTIRTSMPLVQELSGRRRSKPSEHSSSATCDLTERSSRSLKPKIVPVDGDTVLQPLDTAGLDISNTAGSNTTHKNKDKHQRLLSTVATKRVDGGEDGSNSLGKRRPDCVLRRVRRNEGKETVAVSAEVHLPGFSSGRDMSVLAGEDRLVLDSPQHFLDVWLPCTVLAERVTAHFVRSRQVLVVTLPVLTT